MAPNNMNSSDQLEGTNIRGQSQNDRPPIDIELEDEMADSMYFFIINIYFKPNLYNQHCSDTDFS